MESSLLTPVFIQLKDTGKRKQGTKLILIHFCYTHVSSCFQFTLYPWFKMVFSLKFVFRYGNVQCIIRSLKQREIKFKLNMNLNHNLPGIHEYG